MSQSTRSIDPDPVASATVRLSSNPATQKAGRPDPLGQARASDAATDAAAAAARLAASRPEPGH
jgi:hypothetical protein